MRTKVQRLTNLNHTLLFHCYYYLYLYLQYAQTADDQIKHTISIQQPPQILSPCLNCYIYFQSFKHQYQYSKLQINKQDTIVGFQQLIIFKSFYSIKMIIKKSRSPFTNPAHKNQYQQGEPTIDANINTNANIFKQIVNLTKENQFLKSQVQCLRTQLQKIGISKNKYKQKYVKIKNQIQNKEYVFENPKVGKSKGNKNGFQSRTKIREKSGQIYKQRKPLNFSPIANYYNSNNKPNQSNYDAPSTRSDLNRVVSEPRLFDSRNKFIQAEPQNPYHIIQADKGSPNTVNRIGNQKNQQYVLKINFGLQAMVKILQNVLQSIERKEIDYAKFVHRIDGIQTSMGRLINQIKENFSKISVSNKQNQLQNDNIINSQKNKSYSEQPRQKKPLQSQQVNEQKIQGSKAQGQKNRNGSCSPDENPYGSSPTKKQIQKLGRNHKSLYFCKNAKMGMKEPDSIRQNNQQKNRNNQQSQCSSWEILNQIGKELKNWKFSYSDSSLMQKSESEGQHKRQVKKN